MSSMTTELFGGTLEKTAQWIDQIMAESGEPNPERAYRILRGVLHALRDRLTVNETIDLGAQLPLLVRGFYYEGWRPQGRPLKYRHKEEFLQQVALLCPGIDQSQREWAVRAVFKVLARHVTGGEIEQVIHQLPEEVRALWKPSL